jgi:hypothetical protein
MTFPVFSRAEWMATIGQFMSGPHWPAPLLTGVTALDAADAGPVPTEFVADTLNVYDVPFVKPVTDALVAGGDPDTVTGV